MREPKCTKATNTLEITTTTTTKKELEDPIIPPLQFWDDRPLQETDSITDKPSPKIKELNLALKGHAKSYEIEIQDNLNLLYHFTKSKVMVESHLKDLLKIMKEYKFIETLEVTFKKETSNSKTGKREITYKTAFFNGKAKTITNATNKVRTKHISTRDT